MKNNITLDIAILTAGRVDLFDKCVDAILAEMRPNYKIHVCNNGHPSKEYEEVYKKLPQGSVIKRINVDNGFGAGANIAIKSGSAPLVLFVTDDIFIHPGSIEKLLSTMKVPEYSLCGYKFLFPEDSVDSARPAGKVQHIGLSCDIRGNITHPLVGWSSINPKCNISKEVLAVTGASFIVRRSVFNKARGFNPIYGKGYYEDVDLCLTIRAQGGKIYINTEATATHGVGQTFKNEKTPPPIQQNFQIFRSRWLNSIEWTDWMMW